MRHPTLYRQAVQAEQHLNIVAALIAEIERVQLSIASLDSPTALQRARASQMIHSLVLLATSRLRATKNLIREIRNAEIAPLRAAAANLNKEDSEL